MSKTLGRNRAAVTRRPVLDDKGAAMFPVLRDQGSLPQNTVRAGRERLRIIEVDYNSTAQRQHGVGQMFSLRLISERACYVYVDKCVYCRLEFAAV